MRVKIHKQIETFGKDELNRKEIREEIRNTIFTQLLAFQTEKKENQLIQKNHLY
ncbi:hypothetical protein D3C87_2169300 [compost metagenome]